MTGRRNTLLMMALPVLLLVTACTEPVVVIEEPEEVETCEWLIPVGIDLVNDYFYTLQEVDLGPSQGNQALLPDEVLALNVRGVNLDERAAELECDLEAINKAIVAATSGLESTDPVVSVFLETMRAGVIPAPVIADPPAGEWELVQGTTTDGGLELAEEQTVTLVIDSDGVGRGSTGCNQYNIMGVAAAGAWLIEGFEVTDGPCPSADHRAAQEVYLDAMQSVREYAIEGDVLILTGLGGSSVELRFARRPEDSAGE